MVSHKVIKLTYINPQQDKALKKLSKQTSKPMSVYFREGIDLVLKKYQPKYKSA